MGDSLMAGAKLKVIREHRGVIGRFGVFDVIVNNLSVGQIKDGETKVFDIPSGNVAIQMEILDSGTDGEKSASVTCTNVLDAEEVCLGCRSVGIKNKSGIEVWQEGGIEDRA